MDHQFMVLTFKMESLQWLGKMHSLCTDVNRPLRPTVKLKQPIAEHQVYFCGRKTIHG